MVRVGCWVEVVEAVESRGLILFLVCLIMGLFLVRGEDEGLGWLPLSRVKVGVKGQGWSPYR